MSRGESIDFNSVLKVANVFVAGLLVYVLARDLHNEYVDQETLVLGILLTVQTQIALLLERRHRDPFVILLAFGMIFYYAFRIFTLTLYPFSTVFDRYQFDADDSNYALVFILIANTFIYAGLYVVRFTNERQISFEDWRALRPASVVVLMAATFALSSFSGNYWTEDDMPRALTVLVVFLSPPIVVSMALAYYFLFAKTLGRKFALAIGLLIALEIVAHTLWGSRSAIVAFVQMFIIVSLAVKGSIRLSRKYTLLGVVLLPVVVALLVATFTISTFNRATRESGNNALDVGRALASASESAADLMAGPSLDLLLPPIAARAGYFDFAAEIIAHREQYAAVINPTVYAKSVIDNILTPGFDLFDQPKISNALQFVYRDWGEPSKIVAAEFYQSDQFGIYGEFYALFGGYSSVPLLFLVAFLLKRLYVGLRCDNPFEFAMHRVIVLLIFVRLLDSFGIDWVIGEIAPFALATVFYSGVFASRRFVPRHALPRNSAATNCRS